MTNQPRHTLLVLLWALTVAPSQGDPPKGAGPRGGFRQLGKLQAGLAYRAREEERAPIKAALLFLQAAQAFQHGGDNEKGREALVEGLLATQPLRASWVHYRYVVVAGFLPGDRQILTCGTEGPVHIWDVATGREVRSFRAGNREEDTIDGASLSPDRSRLLVWTWTTLGLWDVGKGRLLRKWDRGWRPGPQGGSPAHAGGVFLGGKRLLLWGTAKPAEVWDADGKARLHTIDKGSIEDLSPDGSRLLTADRSAVYLWDLTRGKLLQTFEVGDKKAGALHGRLSRDARHVLVIGKASPTARVFDASTGKRLATIVHHHDDRDADVLLTGVLSPDGTRLLTWGNGRKMRLWDVDRGRVLHTFGGGDFLSARFHRDGTQVLTLGKPVLLWDAKTGELVGRYGDGSDVVLTRDGLRLLIRDDVWKDRVEIWDVKREKRLRVFQTPGTPADVRLSEDETRLLVRVSAQGLCAVQLWDLGQPEGRVVPEEDALPRSRVFRHGKPVRTAVLSRDESHLLTSDEGGRAHLWDTAGGQRVQSFAHGDGILGAAFNPDEPRVLSWGEKGLVKLWDAKTGKELRRFDHPADVRGAAFSTDGSQLLTWDVDYTVWWWDVSRPKPVHRFEHPRDVFGARLSPKGTHVLTWGLDGKARLWDVASGRQVRTLAHDGPVFGTTFADEGRVWTWSPDGLSEWDVTRGKVLRQQKPPDGVASAELSRDGQRFLLRSADGLVRLWDVGVGKTLAKFHDSAEVFELAERVPAGVFSPDQTRALTWPGGSAHLWDLGTGLRLKWFPHPKGIRGAAFARDGSSVLTWGSDGTARLWEASVPHSLSPDEQLLELEARSGLRIAEEGHLQALKLEEWQDRRKKLGAILKKNERP